MKIHSKEDILKEALDIIAYDGIDKLSMSELAKRLGINKSSIYHWFESKEEIIEEAFRYGHSRLMAKGFRLSLGPDALRTAAKAWQDIFTDAEILPYLRTVFSLRFSMPAAEEEARAVKLMIHGQIDVILTSYGYSSRMIPELFSALLTDKLLSELEGQHEDIEGIAGKYIEFLGKSGIR